jgi:hypothetical protein
MVRWGRYVGVIAALAACACSGVAYDVGQMGSSSASGGGAGAPPDANAAEASTDSSPGYEGAADGEAGATLEAAPSAPADASMPQMDTGASSTLEGGPVASVCDGAGTKILGAHDTFIDNFEEAAIAPAWFAFNDVMPIPNAIHAQQVLGGAAGTAHALLYAGGGARTVAAGGFGVGLTYNAAIAPAAGVYCVDISAYDGVSFWAKAAANGTAISLNFVIPQTNPASTDGMGRPNGGDCTTGCFDHPRVSLTLTTGWAQYAVRFSQATGGSAPLENVLQELTWLSPDSDWDFWLDEIAYFKGTPPPGAVTGP